MPGAVTFELKGVEEMRQKLERVTRGMNRAVERALREEAEEIMRRAKNEFVPVDKSTLKNSGFVNDVVRDGDDISVTLGFGGSAEAYALAVHEHPSEHSPRSWGDRSVNFTRGGPKYLEKPLNEAVNGMDKRIAAKALASDILGGI